MNKRVKVLLFSGLIFIYCILLTRSTGTMVITLYNGVSPNSSLYSLLINYYLFSLYSFFIFGSSTKYIQGYGILIVTRSGIRKQLCNKLIKQIVIIVAFFEIIKIFIYFIMFKIDSHVEINFYSLIKENYFFILANIVVMTIFLLIQFFLEIKINSTNSILFTQIIYISTIFFSDYFYNVKKESSINVLFLINYSMRARFELLDFKRYFINGIYFPFLVLIILYLINIKFFDKKDLL